MTLLHSPHVPEEDGAIRAPRAEESLVDRVPGHGTGLLLVSTEHLHLFAEISDVEQLQQVVSAGRDEPVAVLVPLQVHHGRLVGVPASESD